MGVSPGSRRMDECSYWYIYIYARILPARLLLTGGGSRGAYCTTAERLSRFLPRVMERALKAAAFTRCCKWIQLILVQAIANSWYFTYALQLWLFDLGVAIDASIGGSRSQLENIAYEFILLQLWGHAGTHNSAQGRVLMVYGPGVQCESIVCETYIDLRRNILLHGQTI